MKMLAVYNSIGNIIFTQTNATDNYNCLVEEFKPNRTIKGVDMKEQKIIWGDSEEMEKTKQQLRELKEKELTLKKNLLREELKQR